jgi:hypothetical protein
MYQFDQQLTDVDPGDMPLSVATAPAIAGGRMITNQARQLSNSDVDRNHDTRKIANGSLGSQAEELAIGHRH